MVQPSHAFRLVPLVAFALVLTACTSPGDDVVFDSETTSSIAGAPADPSTPTQPPEPSTTPSTEAEGDDAAPTTTASVRSVVSSDEVLAALPGRLAINGSPPNRISVLGEDLSPLIDAESQFAAQPTWSPDAAQLAWSVAAGDGSAAVVVAAVGEATSRTYAVPFVPFYIQWRPDGGALGLLGGTGGGTGLVILDLEDEALMPLHDARSFYFHWAPDGSSMISHLDNSRLELVDPATGEITPIPAETADFQAPAWTPDGSAVLYVRPSATQTAGVGSGFGAQTLVLNELVSHELATNEITVLAAEIAITNFALSPDGTRVAFSALGTGPETLMRVVDLATGDTESIEAGRVFIWQWSPDSQKILLLGVESNMLAFKVWSGGVVAEYGTASPTSIFLNSYLVFWGQYDLSMDLWAPDSSAFVYAAADGAADVVFLQRLADELPVRVGPGGVAFFAPAPG